MLSNKVETALNEQLNAELFSGYLYLSLSAHFVSRNLDGFGAWMRTQAQEEMEHAMKFYDYINDRGGKVDLMEIAPPESAWDSLVAGFEAAFEHEKEISGRINQLVDLAVQEADHATHQFLQWFVTEQVEEEQSVGNVVHKLKMVADSASGLYILDRELAERTTVE